MYRPPLKSLIPTAVAVVLSCGTLGHSLELDGRAQSFTEYLVAGNTRELYRLFVPAFREEHSFARFDSAYRAWVAGRTFSRARSRVMDIQGLGGHVSSWVVFEGEDDYNYIYGSWLQTDEGWQLLWLSKILGKPFLYGMSDTVELDCVADATLHHMLTGGLAEVRRRLVVPVPVVAVWDGHQGERREEMDGYPVQWFNVKEAKTRGALPAVPFLLHFSMVQVLGQLANVAVDLRPTDPDHPGALGGRRSVKLYLENRGDGWRYHSTGKVW